MGMSMVRVALCIITMTTVTTSIDTSTNTEIDTDCSNPDTCTPSNGPVPRDVWVLCMVVALALGGLHWPEARICPHRAC
jgi:hypothetical protein